MACCESVYVVGMLIVHSAESMWIISSPHHVQIISKTGRATKLITIHPVSARTKLELKFPNSDSVEIFSLAL